jgi:hypothetical protein
MYQENGAYERWIIRFPLFLSFVIRWNQALQKYHLLCHGWEDYVLDHLSHLHVHGIMDEGSCPKARAIINVFH